MTRNAIGGSAPLSDAWEQAERKFLTTEGTAFNYAPPASATAHSVVYAPMAAGMSVLPASAKVERLLRVIDAVVAAKTLPVLALASALLFSPSSIPSAAAQTTMGGPRQAVPSTPPTPGAQQGAGQASAMPPAQNVPAREMPTSSVFQAVDQSEGIFPQMARAGAGGQIQTAWDVSEQREGVYAVRMCEDCVYKVRLREFMATTIQLPPDAQIAAVDLGDGVGFQATVKFSNMLAVRPSTYGVDTNLNVYTKSGKVYPFYLRAESFNSINVPDLMVRILGRETPEPIGAAIPASVPGAAGAAVPAADGRQGKAVAPVDMVGAAVADLTSPQPQGSDFVRSVPFDPAKLHGWYDYRLWGDGDEDVLKRLRPKIIYRDTFFTYLQYGDGFDPLSLGTAYVVRDGKDEMINTRVQGNTFIVESTAKVISFKNGKTFLCIEYTGEKP